MRNSRHPYVAWPGLLLAGALLLAGCGSATTGTSAPAATATPGAHIERNVTYCTVAGVTLLMDLYLPAAGASPHPLAVFIHGGGWSGGDKAGDPWLRAVGVPLVAHGFVVASLDYRLAPRYRWPAQIEDVKCAIRSLRAHAADYGVAPSRIGVWGTSAGGHLVSMLGVAGPSAGFDDAGGYTDQSSAVQAVVDMFGPADLTASDFGPYAAGVIQRVFGAAPGSPGSSATLLAASPVHYIASGDPPFLIVQGDRDTTVPPDQSQELASRLQAAGDAATLLMVHNAGHGLVPAGGQMSPSAPSIAQTIVSFFLDHLDS